MQGTHTIKLHFTPNDRLSQRIFKGDEFPASLQSAETLFGLRAEIKALQKENAALQRTLQLSSGLRQRFENLFDTSPLGLLTCDSDDQIVEVNLTLANLLHMERTQLIGKHFGNFIAPSDHAQFIQHLSQLRDDDNAISTHCNVTLITEQHTQIGVRIESTLQQASTYNIATVHSHIVPLENADKPENITELAKNNAELKKEISECELSEEQSRKQQEELAHAGRLNTMGEMASGLAHEISQPLTAINSYTKSCLRLLKGDAEKQAQVPFLLEHVCKQSQRAASIIRHLRDFVSKSASHREATELSHVVKLAINMMRSEFHKNKITLDLKTQADLPKINADAIQLEQVIINLMRNACEAMNDPANKTPDAAHHLHIELDKPNTRHVRIAINDTGPGIDPENAKKISTPFYSTKSNGMGLGLAISRTIIEDHGGKLTHETNSNGGATFIFTLAIDGKQSDNTA